MRIWHAGSGKNGYSVNASGNSMWQIRQIESLHAAIRNASAHTMHVKFLGVTIINGGWPQVSHGRALKSFRMLLDRRRRLVNDLCI